MSPRNQYLLTWLTFMASALLLALGGIYFSNWFAIPFFGSVIVASIKLRQIVCPKCSTPLAFDGHRLRDRKGTPRVWSKRRCAACDHDLSKP